MRTLSRLALVCAIAVCVTCLPAPPRAGAERPLIEESDIIVDSELVANCGDFHIIADGAGTARLWVYFDREGNPARVVFHGRFNGTLTNSVTGASLSDSPSVGNITLDLTEGTQTNVGAFFNVTVPGRGTVLFEVGRLVFDGFGPPVFLAGQHQPPPESVAILCDALR